MVFAELTKVKRHELNAICLARGVFSFNCKQCSGQGQVFKLTSSMKKDVGRLTSLVPLK